MKQSRNDERRDRMIGVKLTDDEYERVRVLAFKARKSLAAYLRDLALEAPATRRRTA